MQPLFRAEAVAHATQRLDGEVLLPAPLATWGAVALVPAVLAVAAWFAATATYGRTESVQGWLAPDGGVARAVSRRDGNVLALMVAEGDLVEAGTPLARIGGLTQFGDGRDRLALDSSQSEEGAYKGSGRFDDAAIGSASDAADTRAMPPDVAVQALVVTAAHALLRDIAELSRQGLDASFDKSGRKDMEHVVTAPISGRVETVVVREGQFISRGSTVALVAASDKLVAEIVVPLRAGFVANGQGLRLRYEGLPFGHQGVQQGIVTQVWRTPLPPVDTDHSAVPATAPVYRVQVQLPAQEIDVGGVSVGLHAGMRLTAEIPAPRRTLFQTLYETIR